MDPLLLILAALLAVGIYLIAGTRRDARFRVARSLAGIFLVALPVGGLGYLFSGIWIARARGVGHFFSVPFGGYAVTDTALLSSLACWVALAFVLASLLFRKRLRRSD